MGKMKVLLCFVCFVSLAIHSSIVENTSQLITLHLGGTLIDFLFCSIDLIVHLAPSPHCLDYDSFTVSLKLRCVSSNLTLFLKVTIKKMKRQVTDRKRILAKHTYDKGLVSRLYKELIKLSKKRSSST